MATRPTFSTNSNRFRTLSLCTIAALCMVGLGAATAHAEAQWRIQGAPLEGEEKENVAVTSNTSQLLEVSGLNIALHCAKLSLDSGVISDKPAGHFQGTLLYTGCTATEKSSGKEAPKCNPLEGKITATALGLLIVHNSRTYLLLQPLTEKPLAIIEFSETCALAETTKLTGQMVVECVPVENCEEAKVTHTIKPNESGLFTDKLKFGVHEASYKGEITLELSGENEGQEWQGLAQPPGTKLCKVAPPENAMTHRLKCPAGPPAEGYPGEIIRGEISAGKGSFTSLLEPAKEITCNEVQYSGKFQESGASGVVMGGINSLTYQSAGGACSSTLLAGEPPVTVTYLNLPYSKSEIFYWKLGNPQGVLAFKPSEAAKPFGLKLVFAGKECEYSRVGDFIGAILNGVGPNPSLLGLSGVWLRIRGEAAACPQRLQETASLTFKRPNPIEGQPDLNAYVAAE